MDALSVRLHCKDCSSTLVDLGPASLGHGLVPSDNAGINLDVQPANESLRYNATPALIGWPHTQIHPWILWQYAITRANIDPYPCRRYGFTRPCRG